MQAAEEDVRPIELSLLRAAVEVFRIRMFEVETDQVDAGGAEVIREEYRPISVLEASEIPEASNRPGLRRRHRRPEEPRGPLMHRQSVVLVSVDIHDRSIDIHFHPIRNLA